jgi:hypothetical protein
MNYYENYIAEVNQRLNYNNYAATQFLTSQKIIK